MKGKIFHQIRHRWVHRDIANGTANGRKQAVDMVRQKLNFHTILRTVRLKGHPVDEIKCTFSLKAEYKWNWNFLFCLLVTFCSEGYTIRLAKLSITGIGTTFMDVILDIFWKYWTWKTIDQIGYWTLHFNLFCFNVYF